MLQRCQPPVAPRVFWGSEELGVSLSSTPSLVFHPTHGSPMALCQERLHPGWGGLYLQGLGAGLQQAIQGLAETDPSKKPPGVPCHAEINPPFGEESPTHCQFCVLLGAGFLGSQSFHARIVFNAQENSCDQASSPARSYSRTCWGALLGSERAKQKHSVFAIYLSQVFFLRA